MKKFPLPFEPLPEKPGMYRRSFNWRFRNADRTTVEDQVAAVLGLYNSEKLDILEDCLYISRKRTSNRSAMARLISLLIWEHLTTEPAIKQLKEQLKTVSTSGTEERTLEVQSLNRRIQELRLYANCLRVIGDGIAWRALGFDRTALRALCRNRGCQNLLSEGLADELDEWSSHFEGPDAFAIPNAITNWLTIGDVTVIEKNGSVEVVEVKSGRTKSSRNVRQREGLREVVSFLNSGSRTENQNQFHSYDLNVEAEHGLDMLEPLFAQSEQSGYAMKEISSFYFVDCVDRRRFPADVTIEKINKERDERVLNWVGSGGLTWTQSSLNFLTFAPTIAPFSIFPLPERTCVELMIGTKVYRVTINLGAVAREFERRGWRVVPPEILVQKRAENDPEDPISRSCGPLVMHRDGVTTEIPVEEIHRMQMELLRPQVVIKAFDQLLSVRQMERQDRHWYEYKLRESHIWR